MVGNRALVPNGVAVELRGLMKLVGSRAIWCPDNRVGGSGGRCSVVPV
ncbi:hypothetical protein A3Q56_01859 [Intoshia linei]|uniref:Uncharacterized protein n=1 Tax=Intoshia linei TaxID=1819745 RepID=A0A177B7V9_9BILA|nr:hypothetical protein A3Q56_01859 [Intoshia linei]